MKRIIKMMAVSTLALGLLTSCGGSEEGFSTDSTIDVVTREDGSGTRGAFVELFGIEVEDENGNKEDMTYEEAIVANKTDVVITTVQGDLNGIGYISLGSLNENVKPVSINGVEATKDNVLTGEYEVVRPFNIATKGTPNELTSDFISFIFSAEGQAIVGNDFVPVATDSLESYSPSGLSGTITVGGSTSVAPLMEELKEAYEELNPEVTIEVQSLGSSAGMQGAMDGTFDIGMASRELKDSEKAELNSVEIAYDAIAVIVNNENPITDLTSENVRQIFTGEVTTWNEVQ